MLQTVTFVVLFVVVSGGNDDSLWNSMISKLPESLKTKVENCAHGIAIACTFVFSSEEEKIENVVNKMLETVRSKTLEQSNAPTKDRKLGTCLGYICWSAGKVFGLKTITKVGKAEVKTIDSKTEVNIVFSFENLKLEYDKCGYENGPLSVKGKCIVNLGNHKLRVTFQVQNMRSFLSLVYGIWKKDCMLKIVNFKMESLKKFGLSIKSRDGSKPSLTKGVISKIVNNIKGTIKYLITRKALVSMYNKLKSENSYVCKDEALEALVNHKYTKYLTKPKPKSPRLFGKLCGEPKDADIMEDEEDGKKVLSMVQ